MVEPVVHELDDVEVIEHDLSFRKVFGEPGEYALAAKLQRKDFVYLFFDMLECNRRKSSGKD